MAQKLVKYAILDKTYFPSSKASNVMNSLNTTCMITRLHSEIQQFLIIVFTAKLEQFNIFWLELGTSLGAVQVMEVMEKTEGS